MTFLEAAIEILRHANGSLHFAEVARRAVEENLLSHVGRDPEAAMRTCLNSAIRGNEPILVRDKPGYYGIRPGAHLPDPPPRPAAKKLSNSEDSGSSLKAKPDVRTSKKASKAARTKAGSSSRGASDAAAEPTRRRRRTAVAEEPVVEEVEEEELAVEPPVAEGRSVEFEAPSGSGLDGVTDVALVMANAVSRLVGERPELRDELDAMQQPKDEGGPSSNGVHRASRDGREPREPRDSRESRDARESRDSRDGRDGRGGAPASEDRGGRRRRRRRRRGKRVDWSGGVGGARSDAAAVHHKLLDGVESVLEESGPRSLHVRQIAETLAGRGVLGGEISEIERAVTAALLLDLHAAGRASRFVARGDARYQLQGTRLPEAAARAERELRAAVAQVERETEAQIIQWLQSLGSRSLESLVRVYLQREGFALLSALPPARGVGRLVVEDPDADDEGRLLVLVIPRRTAVDPKLWEGEPERQTCTNTLLIAMGEVSEDVGDARVIGPGELGNWLRTQGFGVQTVTLEVPVLDMAVIESIGGLDT